MNRRAPQTKQILFLLGIWGLFLSPTAFAVENAQTLPKGVRRLWVIGIVSNDVDSRYSGDGRVENITPGTNKTLTMKDFQRSEPKLRTLVKNLNDVEAGLGDRLEAYSNVYNNYTIRKEILIPTLQYGATDRLTIGVRAEVVKRVVSNRITSNSVSNSDQLLKELGSRASNPAVLVNGLETLSEKNLTPSFVTYRMFDFKGYESPNDFTRTDLGDIEVGAKYKFFDNGAHMSALQSRAILPTGKPKPLNNPFDSGSGYGAWGTGLEFYHEYFPARFLSFGGAAIGRYYFPDRRDRAVPLDADDTLPSLRIEDGQVEAVRRKSGQELRTEASATVHIPGDLFKVWGAYQYWVKGSDRFSGNRSLFYQGLSKDTGWNVSMWEAGVRFSTIPLYRRGQFRAPMELDASYNSSFSGRNIREASYARLDLKLYF